MDHELREEKRGDNTENTVEVQVHRWSSVAIVVETNAALDFFITIRNGWTLAAVLLVLHQNTPSGYVHFFRSLIWKLQSDFSKTNKICCRGALLLFCMIRLEKAFDLSEFISFLFLFIKQVLATKSQYYRNITKTDAFQNSFRFCSHGLVQMFNMQIYAPCISALTYLSNVISELIWNCIAFSQQLQLQIIRG